MSYIGVGLAVCLCAARIAVAQATPAPSVTGATISGVVYDSIAKAPLAGADVQLVAADNPALLGPTAVSDASGKYALANVQDGRYKLGFFHPMLDSIGVDLPLRDITVSGPRAIHADLSIPGPARIRAAVCGKDASADQGAVVLGIVRDASNGSPVAGVSVTGQWMEIAIDKGGMFRRMPTRTATTGDNGWFALCNVPSGGTMSLRASRAADSTDEIEVDVPAEGFLRHGLYIGSTRTVAAASTRPGDSIVAEQQVVHYGNGRVSGTVLAAAGGKAVGGAQVSIVGGPHVTANEKGEFTITEAPTGTRMLEVRSLGYYPDRRSVDVVPGAPPIRVVLSTFRAVLDTVKIRARRLADRHDSGFEERKKRSGAGKFLTAEDIERRGSAFASGIFRSIPGVRVFGDNILVRGAFEEWCVPEFYVDGHFRFTYSGEDLDAEMLPKDIASIEVYPAGTAPNEFSQGMGGCGSIVIWTK